MYKLRNRKPIVIVELPSGDVSDLENASSSSDDENNAKNLKKKHEDSSEFDSDESEEKTQPKTKSNYSSTKANNYKLSSTFVPIDSTFKGKL
jgi:hypothetical protein